MSKKKQRRRERSPRMDPRAVWSKARRAAQKRGAMQVVRAVMDLQAAVQPYLAHAHHATSVAPRAATSSPVTDVAAAAHRLRLQDGLVPLRPRKGRGG